MTTNAETFHHWTGLRSPHAAPDQLQFVAVAIASHHWRKIIDKHLCVFVDAWADVFGSELVKERNDHTNHREMLDVLGKQIAGCLDHPLLILYSCIGERINGIGHRWLLLLPCGAVAYVWEEKSERSLRTCYFKGAVGVKPLEDRLRTAIRQQTLEYAIFDKESGEYLHPSSSDRHESSSGGELHFNKRFVSPKAWGFRSAIPGDKWCWSEATTAIRLSETSERGDC